MKPVFFPIEKTAQLARGFTLNEGDSPVMVVSVTDQGDRHVLCATFACDFRAKLDTFHGKRALLMAARRAVDLVATIPGPVDAVAGPFPRSAEFLERMGFRHLHGRIYRFAGLTLREKVHVAEAEMSARGTPVEIPVSHYFADGLYAREAVIPAGTIATGKIHKRTNLLILLSGEASFLTDEGVKRVKAPFTVISPAGTKRLVYTHTDCVLTAFHGTCERDLDKIEQLFIAQSEADFLGYVRSLERRTCPLGDCPLPPSGNCACLIEEAML